MNRLSFIEEKNIFAKEPQRIVDLKLAYNKLASKYNREMEQMTEKAKQEIIASLSELNRNINLSI